MQQRQGTKDVGMEYQFKVITFVAASLSVNDDVQDFVIYSNADNIPGFDDVIVKVWFKTEEQPHVYLGQVKHRHSKINFDGEKHKLADYEEYVAKIVKDKDQINILSDVPSDNIEFWFYSNNFVSKSVKLERRRDQSEPILCSIAPNKNYKSIVPLEKPAGCFKLVPKDASFSEDFFRRFHLFLNQPNNSKIDYVILRLLEFSKSSIDTIIKYVDKFLNIPKITGLTKRIFETEVFNIHLFSITVKPTAAAEMNIEQARIWNEITLTHDATVVDDYPDVERNIFGCFWQQLNDVYNCQFTWNDCIRNKGRLADNFDVQQFVDRSKLHKIRYWLVSPDTVDALLIEMWKQDDLPRILKPATDLSILLRYRHLQKRFIIIGNAIKMWDEQNSSCLKIFTDVASICSPQLRIDLLTKTIVSLQGRNPSNLSDIIAGDERCMKLLRCHHVLDLIKRRKVYLKRECFEKTELMIYLIIDGSDDDVFNVEARKNDDKSNILIHCDDMQVDMYLKEFNSRKTYDNYLIHVLRRTDRKIEYLRGNSAKIRKFLVDQDGESVYRTDQHEAIPIIGKGFGLKGDDYIIRHLRKAAVDITALDKEAEIICVVYGDVNSLKQSFRKVMVELINLGLEIDRARKETVIVAVEEKIVEEYWKKLCSENHRLILLKASNGCLELIKYKNVHNLSKYISYSEQTFTEDDFYKEITNNLIVISGEPGMGKTYLLQKLFEICSGCDYVLLFNLSDYRRDFQQSTREFLEDPLNFFFRKLEMPKFPDLIEGISEAHKSTGRLTVLLDSFDEILPFYEKKVLDLLGRIVKLNVRVVICSRLISHGILVDEFEIQLLRIDLVRRYDLVEYLANRNIKDIDLAKIPNAFLENPLYLKFLIFLHQEGSVDFTQVNVFDLYRKFVAKIVERYCRKYNQDYNPEITISTEKFLKNHRLLALLVLFGKETVLEHRIITNYDALEMEFKCVDVKLGIVKYFSEGYPVFVHQTFAEFMAMEWLNVNLFHDPSAEVIYGKMYMESDLNVRYLFDSMACNQLPLHKAVLNDDLKTVCRLCLEDEEALVKVDKCGRTALHLASGYCLQEAEGRKYEIVEAIVKHMLRRNYNLNAKDAIMCWSWRDCLEHKRIDIIKAACSYNLPTILEVCLTGQETQIKRYLQMCYRKHVDLCLKFFEKSNELLSKHFYEALQVSMDSQRLDITCRLMELAHMKCEYEDLIITRDPSNVTFRFPSSHTACMQNNEAKLMDLLRKNMDVDQNDIFGRIPLHYSAICGSVSLLTKLIDHTLDIDAGDDDDNAPLHFAFRYANVESALLLLERGADASKVNKYGESALHFAIYNWEVESEEAIAITEMFAERFTDTARSAKGSKSLLWIASFKGFAKIVQILLEKGANPMEKDPDGETAMHAAVSRGHGLIFRSLLESNRDLLHVQNDWGQTVTDLAVLMRKMDVIKYLLEDGLEQSKTDPNGNTLSHVAARWGKVDILETLIREKHLKRSDLALRNYSDRCPLHLAVAKNYADVVRFLLSNGVDVDPIDEDGCAPLHYAVSGVVAKLLLDRYGDRLAADVKSNDGKTPLHKASEKGYTDVILELLEVNFDICTRDNSGFTPLHLAIINRKHDAACLLVESSAHLDIACNNLETCLHKAVTVGNSEIARLLLEKGANIHVKNASGNTALHLRILCYESVIQAVQEFPTRDVITSILLEYGADAHVLNDRGESPMDIAKRLNLELLLYQGELS